MPNDDLGSVNTTSSYKEKYSSMKDKLKHILYENELYHDELIRLKRELIDIYSDKDILINRIIESGVDLGTSDDDENDEISQFSDIVMPASTSKCNNISTNNQTDSDATSRIITLTADPNVTTISTSMTTAGMPTIVMNGPSTTQPIQATTTIESCASLELNKAASLIAATNSRAKPKCPAAPRSRAKVVTTASNKVATTKAATTKAATTSKATASKAPSSKVIKSETDSAPMSENGGSVTTTNSDTTIAVNEEGSAAKPKPKRKRPTAPKKTAAEKKVELEQQPPDNQSSQQQSPLVASEEVPGKPAKPPAPKRVRKPAVKKPKLTPQAATPQEMQHSPMTVMGQVQLPVSLPNEQIKFVQHVNLPEQNLIGNNGNIILTNHAGNQIQVQHLHHFQQQNNQNHHRLQDNNNDNNNHQQIQIQLPHTTTSTMESFQTPQSIITTSQGGQQQLSGFGQHQSYTIVASNGNLIQHDLNQNHSPQPTTVHLTTAQSMSLNQAIQQHNNGNISSQTICSSNMQTHQGMPTQQETIQTINFQTLQHNSNGQQSQSQQQQQHQQQQDDGNNYGSHQIIQFELPRQIQLSQVSQHQQQIHNQLQQMQPQQHQQTQQQMQMQQQMTPVRSSSAQIVGANEDLEQQRRIDQQAAALLMNDWESSVASELFGSDSIKFMAED